jgi:UDP-N-acetylmuramoyl-tripeptide--D-alanyl-D-alanine ligase
MRWSTLQIAHATGGLLGGDDPQEELRAVSIDTRTMARGSLFVALRAERDGHQFLAEAVRAGAAGLLVESGHPALDSVGPGVAVVEVADTADGLLRIGVAARARLAGPVVGITGSVGKTSTKDLAAAALAARWRVAASAKSFNNELGVPLTLANAADDTQVAVVELGARASGQLTRLCQVVRPTVAVVTAVAAAHTETFGTIEAVWAAKRELVDALPPDGTAVLNADDAMVASMARHAPGEVLMWSASGDPVADVVAEEITVDEELRPRFRLRSPWGQADVRLGIRGRHQVSNALAAASVALSCGVAVDTLPETLADARLSPWRMELVRTGRGARVLNDAYNANPTSVAAALDALVALPAHRRVAVLGEMAELGSLADAEHRAVAQLAADLGVEMIAVGTDRYGVVAVADVDEAIEALGPLGPDDAVLVKASRVAGLELLAGRLVSG